MIAETMSQDSSSRPHRFLGIRAQMALPLKNWQPPNWELLAFLLSSTRRRRRAALLRWKQKLNSRWLKWKELSFVFDVHRWRHLLRLRRHRMCHQRRTSQRSRHCRDLVMSDVIVLSIWMLMMKMESVLRRSNRNQLMPLLLMTPMHLTSQAMPLMLMVQVSAIAFAIVEGSPPHWRSQKRLSCVSRPEEVSLI